MRVVSLFCLYLLPLLAVGIHHDTEQHAMEQEQEENVPPPRAKLSPGFFIKPGTKIPNHFLMNEPDLIRATQGGLARKHNVASIHPWSLEQLIAVQKAELQWFINNNWLLNGGYEWNWDYMYEPITKRYRSYVIPQKSQRCGTCWAFSTSAMISAHIAVKYGIDRATPQWWPEDVDPISLAEGELFECTAAAGSDTCFGNWIQNAAALVQSSGIAQNSDYAFNNANAAKCRGDGCGPKCPYKSPLVVGCNEWPQTCPAITDSRRKNNPRFTIDHLVSVVGQGPPGVTVDSWVGSSTYPLQVQVIRNLLRTKGPLGFYFRVESGFGLDGNDIFPSNGAVYTRSCLSTGLNHAMLLIGYGRTPNNHPTQPNMDYWLVLNSWGNWSTDGIIKIQAGNNLCGMEQIVFYPELPSADIAAKDPCTSQSGGLSGQLSCYRSLCEGTILSDSRYCLAAGRANFCSRARSHCPAKACAPKCKCVVQSPTYTKCWTDCVKANKNNPCLQPQQVVDCYYYDTICRVKIRHDLHIDITADLDKLVANVVNLKQPIVATTIIPKPLPPNAKLPDLVAGIINTNPSVNNVKLGQA